MAICLAALLAGIVIPIIDKAFVGSVPYVFEGGPNGARTLLGTIAGAMISVTGLVFSVTIVVLQLASSQFTPRIIPQFLASRITQGTLGFFLATFIFALTVMRAVRGSNEDLTKFVPDVAVTVAFLLVLISVGYFLAFIHNITSSIQVSRIISRLGKTTVAVVDRVYPETNDAAGQDDPDTSSESNLSADATWSPRPDASRTDIVAPDRYGRVTSIDYPALVDAADAIDAVVVIEIDHGHFVAEGERLAIVWGKEDLDDARRRAIERAFHLGDERSMAQDVAFGFRQLIDIAERALSPGINDPTTAAQTIDELHRTLRRIVQRDPPSRYMFGSGGHVRVVNRLPTFQFLLDLTVDEIAHYGRDSIQIPRRLLTMLEVLRECGQSRYADTIDAAAQRVRHMTDPEVTPGT